MTRSMTGFGLGRDSDEILSVVAEIRSVNNRFLDISFRLPKSLYVFEQKIREIIQGKISRGRISLFISEEWTGERISDINLDIVRAKSYAAQLRSLCAELNIEEGLKLEHLLSFNDLFSEGESESYRERLWKLTQKALNSALDQLIECFNREGETLKEDMLSRIAQINSHVITIRDLAPNQVSDYKERLQKRLNELVEDGRIDPARLETEIAIIADKLDISEELVRLESHSGLFSDTIKEGGSVGKKLGFVLQEMGREVNTIASKSWSIEISHTAIKIKELLEQIREQMQNIE